MSAVFAFTVYAEIPDKKTFILEFEHNSDIEPVHLVVGNFCSTEPIGNLRLWCHVVPQYDYEDVLDYLRQLALLPYPKTEKEKTTAKRIKAILEAADDFVVPSEWLFDGDVKKAYTDRCHSGVSLKTESGVIIKARYKD